MLGVCTFVEKAVMPCGKVGPVQWCPMGGVRTEYFITVVVYSYRCVVIIKSRLTLVSFII